MGARRVKRYRVVTEHRTEVCRSCWLWYVKRVLHTEGRYGWAFCPLDGFIWDWYGLIKGAGGSACTLTNWICQVPRCDVDFSSKLLISYQGMPSAFWGAHLKVRGFCSVRFRPVRFAQPSCLSWRGGLREWIWHPVVESLPICRTNENQWKSYVSSNSGFSSESVQSGW